MSTPETADAGAPPAFSEAESKELAAALTTLGRLLPAGMAVTVAHLPGTAPVVAVTYPDGSTTTGQFQGPTYSTIH